MAGGKVQVITAGGPGIFRWGGPPGLRGSPRTRWSLLGEADEGVGCRPGGPPHYFGLE